MIIFAIPVPEESSFESKTGLKPVLMRVADYLFDSTTRSFYPHQIWPLDRVWYVEKSSGVNSRGMSRIEMLIHTLIESDYLSKEDLSCSCSHLALSKKAGPLPLSVVLIDNFYPGRTFDAFDYFNKIHENHKKISKTIKTKKNFISVIFNSDFCLFVCISYNQYHLYYVQRRKLFFEVSFPIYEGLTSRDLTFRSDDVTSFVFKKKSSIRPVRYYDVTYHMQDDYFGALYPDISCMRGTFVSQMKNFSEEASRPKRCSKDVLTARKESLQRMLKATNKHIEKQKTLIVKDGRKLKETNFVAQMALFGTEIDLSENVTEMLKKLTDSMHNISNVLTGDVPGSWRPENFGAHIGDSLNNLANKLPDLSSVGGSGFSISAIFKKMGSMLPVSLLMLASGYKAYTTSSPIWISLFSITSVAGLAIFSGKYYKRVKKVFDSCVAYLTDKSNRTGFEAQSADKTDYSGFSSLVLAVVSWLTISKVPSANKLKSFVDLASKIERAHSGVEYMITHVIKLVEVAVNFIRSRCLGLKHINLLSTAMPQVTSWCDRVDEIAHLNAKGSLAINAVNADNIFTLKMQGLDLTKDSPLMSSARVRYAMSSHMNILNRLALPFEQANIAGGGPRMEPYTILMQGGTGVGKSYATIPIVKDLLNNVLTEGEKVAFNANYMDFVYCRQQEHKYWDGYRGQFVTVFDDFGQIRDSIGIADNEFMDIIRASNMFPNICHMANIEAKGNTTFRSKVILCSTNLTNLHTRINSLVAPEAVMRRFDACIVVRIDKPYQCDGTNGVKGSLNTKHEFLVGKGFCPDVYMFDILKEPDGPVVKTLRYHELNDYLTHGFNIKQDKSNLYLNDLANTTKFSSQANFDTDCFPSSSKDECVLNDLNSEFEKEFDDSSVFFDDRKAHPDDLLNSTIKHYSLIDLLKSTTPPPYHVDPSVIEQLGKHSTNKIEMFRQWVDKFTNDDTIHIWTIILVDNMYQYMGPCILECIGCESSVIKRVLTVFFSRYALAFAADISNKFCEPEPTILEDLYKPRRVMLSYWDRFKKFFVKFNMKYNLLWDFGMVMSYFGWMAAVAGGYKLISMLSGERSDQIEKDPSIVKVDEARNYCYKESKDSPIRHCEDCNYTAEPDVDRDCSLSLIYNARCFKTGEILEVSREVFPERCCDNNCRQKIWHNKHLMIHEKFLGVQFKTLDEGGEDPFAYYNESFSNSRDAKEPHHARRGAAKKSGKNVVKNVFTAQGGADINAIEVISKLTKNHIFTISNEDCSGKVGSLLALRDNIFLMPYHFKVDFDSNVKKGIFKVTDSFKLKNVRTNEIIALDYSVIDGAFTNDKLRGLDLCLVQLPKSGCRIFPDIVKLFCNRRQIDNMRACYFHLVVPRTEYSDVWGCNGSFDRDEEIRTESGSYTLKEFVTYRAPTIKGDCGSPLVLHNSAISPQKIVGIHVAGNSNRHGLACVVTSDDLEAAISEFVEYKPQSGDYFLPFEGNFDFVRKLPVAIYAPKRSRIIKSALYECWGPSKTDTARLRNVFFNGLEINPKYQAIERYGGPEIEIDGKLANYCADAVWSSLENTTVASTYKERTVITFEKAILGDPFDEYFDSIPRATSAGYPYVAHPVDGYRGKEWFFGKDIVYDLETTGCKQLKNEVLMIVDLASKGQRLEHIFVDVLKDERRPLEKVISGKTRLISSAPLPLVVATRMYFMRFCQFIMLSRLDNEIAVGVNVYSDEWHVLANMLQKKGKHCVAGDFKNFDGSEQVVVLEAVLSIIQKWYDGSALENKVRQVLWEDVTNSRHLCDDIVYDWHKSLPSGHPATTIINSLYNLISYRMAWMLLAEPDLKNMKAFSENVFLMVYGDDSVANVSANVISWYNQQTLVVAMAQLGLGYTAETKQGETSLSRNLAEITFLKRSFRFDHQVYNYLAPLSLETILEMPYWTKRGALKEDIERDNVETSLKELSLHDERVFLAWSPLIIRSSKDAISFVPTITSYKGLQDLVRGSSLVF